MDDQNQTNKPLDQGTVPATPIVPSVPEDITPQEAPVAVAPIVSEPTPEPPAPPVETVPAAPWISPEPTTVPDASLVSTPTPVTSEPPMPEPKHKSKMAPIVGGLVALLLVVGVAGAAYYVSNQLSTRQAVAPNAPTSKPLAVDCGAQNCSGNTPICCCTGCFSAGTDCSLHGGVTCTYVNDITACEVTNRDAPSSNSITFAKAGKVIPFVKNDTGGGYTGTITLSKTGSVDINITLVKGVAVELAPFNVLAGDVYTIKIRFDGDPKDAYGWIPNKSANICGPVKTPGAAIDANSKPTGKCGDEVNISAVETLAAKTDLAGITAGGTNATVQCWGDADLGDATQDYDYNDFTLIFGYEKVAGCVPNGTVTCSPDCPTACGTPASTITTCLDSCGTTTTKACVATADCGVGACMLLNIYKKVDGVYGTTPLNDTQLRALKEEDLLKFTLNSSADNLKGRFRVTISTSPTDIIPGTWLTGTIDATNKKLVTYSDFAVTVAGTYQFEAQVSKVP